MRNITAKELTELAKLHHAEGDHLVALGYEVEGEKLQDEMNRENK